MPKLFKNSAKIRPKLLVGYTTGMIRRRWQILLSLFLLGFLIAAGWYGLMVWFRWYLQSNQIAPLVPGSLIQVEESIGPPTSPKKVYGYVPYWNVYTATPSAVLTDVAYFSLTLSGTGEIVEQVDGGPDMGLRRMQSDDFTEWQAQRRAQFQKTHITFTMLQNDDIDSLLVSQPAQQRAIQNITQVLASYPFAGVNLDVEYGGSATNAQRRSYAEFVAAVKQAMSAQAPGAELSVAVYGSAASKQLLWDVPALEPSVDYFIMMAYDYHVRSSSTAGPVAPIFGKQAGRWQDDIVSNLRDLLLDVPPQKILLGIPFYGYEWTTTGLESGSNTFPGTGSTALYQRVMRMIQNPTGTGLSQVTEHWDEDALSPYLTYTSRGDNRVLYYENARSLSYKLDLVRQVDLGGVAIWAVGYEGDNPELWDVIQAKLGTPTAPSGL